MAHTMKNIAKNQTVSKGKAGDTGPSMEDKFRAEDDARTLISAHEVHSDPGRHAAATDHIEKKAADYKEVHKDNRKALEKRVKKGLKQAFPKSTTGDTANAAASPVTGKGKK